MSRKLITFSRIITTGMVNFVRNAWLAIAAMAVMIITLTIVLFSIVTNAAFNNTIAQITDKIDVSVYLKDSTDKTAGQELANGLRGLPNAKSVTYLSKEEALQRYERPVYNALTGEGPGGWYDQLSRNSALFCKEQFAVFRAVHQWRDAAERVAERRRVRRS